MPDTDRQTSTVVSRSGCPSRSAAILRLGVTIASVASLALGCSLAGPPQVASGAATGTVASSVLSVSPSTNLMDSQTVSVVITGASAGSIYLAAECDPRAFTLLASGESPADACEARHNAVLTVDAGGVAATTLQPQAVITTSLGAGDCRAIQCFVAVESLYSTGGPALLLQNITFSPSACTKAKTCVTPSDSWDPSLPASTLGTTHVGAQAASVPRAPSPRHGTHSPSAKPGSPVSIVLTAGQAGDLNAAGAIAGPYTSAFAAPTVPITPVAGDGLLRLAMSAPKTSWGAKLPSSTVVDITLTDTTTSTTVSTQQFVLYDGANTFTYAGFTGPATTADAYQVTVNAEASHSAGGQSWPQGSSTPTAMIVDSQLEVVDPSNPQYLAMAYAPVMFGRSTSALHDVPLLVDATATPVANGATTLSYTVIWSHEDTGTGFVPFLEWGTWGRMTDIENAISFTVASDGSVSNASDLWGGEPATGFPDSQGAIQEVDQPFTGQWDGHHPILRDATGNNDFSQSGTTPFRFQLAPVPGPAAGQTRESVMDANPFTYTISGQEVARWYGDVSTDPQSPQPGDARQYASIDLDTSGTAVSSIAVDLQLAASPTWYASDLHSGYPANGTGHIRTVVKLPTGWQSQPITGVQLQVYPPSAASSVTVNSIKVLALQPNWSLTTETIPTPLVVGGITSVPTALTASATKGNGQQVHHSASVAPLQVTVYDALGMPLSGVQVTFAAGASGVRFKSCGCASVTVTTGAKGTATSGKAIAPASDGPVVITASTIDAGSPPAAFNLLVSG